MRKYEGELVYYKRCLQELSRVLQWFGHMERMDKERLVKKIVESEVRGVRLRGRPRMGWMDSVKRALYMRGLTVEQGRMTARDRNEWRRIVSV